LVLGSGAAPKSKVAYNANAIGRILRPRGVCLTGAAGVRLRFALEDPLQPRTVCGGAWVPKTRVTGAEPGIAWGATPDGAAVFPGYQQ